jgi:hypothetical protein
MATPAVLSPVQVSLLDDVERVERPWKRTTGTSREAVRVFEASGDAETRRRQVTLVIRALCNRNGRPPTARDIAIECKARGYIRDDHPDYVKPRISELYKGYWVTVTGDDGLRARVLRGGGLVEPAGKRKCSKTGKTVHTWRVVERGTGEALR